MEHLSRRGFIKLTGTTVVLYPFGQQLFANETASIELRLRIPPSLQRGESITYRDI